MFLIDGGATRYGTVSLRTDFNVALEKTGFRQQRANAVLKCADLKEKELLTYEKLKLEYKDLKKNYLQAYRNLYNATQAIRNCAFSIIPVDSKRRRGYTSHYRNSLINAKFSKLELFY